METSRGNHNKMQQHKRSSVLSQTNCSRIVVKQGLLDCMKANLFTENGGALTKYEEKLPLAQAKLAQEITHIFPNNYLCHPHAGSFPNLLIFE